jgi:hypothetical protein
MIDASDVSAPMFALLNVVDGQRQLLLGSQSCP